MILKLILKKISIKNNDTDSYGNLLFSLELNKSRNYEVNLNELYELRHKELIANITIK